MQTDFNSSFGEYLSSRIEAATSQHMKYNPSYHNMKKKHENFYELADEIVDELPYNDREIMMHYFEMDSTLKAEDGVIIYHQGMKDCISILQALGVL